MRHVEERDEEMNKLGVRDLVTAAADAWQWRNAAAELCNWHRRNYELLRLALGIEVDFIFAADLSAWEDPTWGLVRETTVSVVTIPNPFGAYLEAPPQIIELYQRHAEGLRGRREAMEENLIDLAVDAIALVAPAAGSRKTTRAALQAAGLPAEEPDID
jgi:hypothetical protein